MASLAAIQRLAVREAGRIGALVEPTFRWAGPRTCKLGRLTRAHAHTATGDPLYGTVCMQRGIQPWRDTVKHEVAHFVRGAKGHDVAFYRARAQQGDERAKQWLRHRGKARCGRHAWNIYIHNADTWTQQCARCGATRPAGP